MPLFFAVKHLLRSWRLFLALLVGVSLACTFFAGIDIKTSATAKQAYEQQLSRIYVDVEVDLGRQESSQIVAPLLRVGMLHVGGVIDVELISRASGIPVRLFDENNSVEYGSTVVAIANNSRVYSGWSNRPTLEIGENETWVEESSALAGKVRVGDLVQISFAIHTSQLGWTSIPLNLTVEGFAKLDNEAYSIMSNDFPAGMLILQTGLVGSQDTVSHPEVDLLIVSWESTLKRVMDEATRLESSSSPAETSLLIYLDRDALIAPWDIDSSLANIYDVESKVRNVVISLAGVQMTSYLEYALNSLRSAVTSMRFAFTVVSLTIFFVAWYVGTTVSEVSFNLRRRETGLLSTKGFSRGQILRLLLTQTLLIGVFGGALGLLSAFLLVPLFTQFSLADLFNPHLITSSTVIFTVAFGTVVALLSTFSSARKASQLAAVDALREYLPGEDIGLHRKKWPWIALVLGTYKIVVFALGVNMYQELTGVMFVSGNIVLVIIIGIFVFLDLTLNYIGPLLFFWGFTKLFIQFSLRFQELASRAASFLGDLSALAAKNVRRNPARSAATAFLIALIIGYGVQVISQLSSEQDYARRQAYLQVGSDVTINVAYPSEASRILNAIVNAVSEEVQAATVEYSVQASDPRGVSIETRAVDPDLWPKTAFTEDSWFSGEDVRMVFKDLAESERTIILDRTVAQLNDLGLGDFITLRFGSSSQALKVVAFFGPGPSMEGQRAGVSYGSFVSSVLYDEISGQVASSARILLKLRGGVDGKALAVSVRNLNVSGINSIESFAESWEESQTDAIKMASLDVQRLAVVFAVLAASAGTALVNTVGITERRREATIMSVKGLSYRQLLVVFLTENLSLAVFSVALGVIVGVVVAYGNISVIDSFMPTVIRHRLVLPLDATLLLVSCVSLIFISTIVPTLVLLRGYAKKLERVIRLR